jgi:hypothetical protein
MLAMVSILMSNWESRPKICTCGWSTSYTSATFCQLTRTTTPSRLLERMYRR